ncbi:ABC transporter substrate-binding protein [Mesorhizobium sp. YR577]|uniref:ABC transporter substrate-binding protein n=1 Tax=Mesorhizobium sp. YR577 TaxID=1884373 RepID=UPI0008E4BD70|nr:ABC transporter substrate-binding protein [Mesorhizobium sp. YR577]SFU21184.1 peptide/nickel transport system substrate-binding protein [Mesorhizobium sp. YR577]
MRLLKALALAAAILLPIGVASAQDSEITIARQVSTSAMDPGFLREAATIVDNIFDTLVMRDKDMTLVPGLAESWTAIDDTTWEFKLRQGVKFHNGEAFNADAVKFTIDRIIDPNAKSPTLSYIRTISSVEVVDPYTVRIKTSGPDPLLPTRMSRYPAYIVPPGYVKEVGNDVFASKPVGTGPYKFVEFIPDQHVVLEANPDYWRGKPLIQRVTWRAIPDGTARLTALVTGEVDLIENVPVDLAPIIAQSPDADLVQVKNGGLTIYLGLVMNEKPLDNVKVRQALDLAIDRQSIVTNILQGMATPTGTQVGVADFGYLNIPPAPYDPEKAKKLLAEAGFPEGFSIKMQSTHRYMKDGEVAQAIAQQFGDIGVKIDQEVLDWSVYVQQVPRKGPIFMLGWGSTQTLDADAAVYAIMKTGEPYSTASIPELDKLLDQSREIVDPAARKLVLENIQKLAAEQAPLLPLYQEDALYGKAKKVNFQGRPDARIPVFDITMQ